MISIFRHILPANAGRLEKQDFMVYSNENYVHKDYMDDDLLNVFVEDVKDYTIHDFEGIEFQTRPKVLLLLLRSAFCQEYGDENFRRTVQYSIGVPILTRECFQNPISRGTKKIPKSKILTKLDNRNTDKKSVKNLQHKRERMFNIAKIAKHESQIATSQLQIVQH